MTKKEILQRMKDLPDEVLVIGGNKKRSGSLVCYCPFVSVARQIDPNAVEFDASFNAIFGITTDDNSDEIVNNYDAWVKYVFNYDAFFNHDGYIGTQFIPKEMAVDLFLQAIEMENQPKKQWRE